MTNKAISQSISERKIHLSNSEKSAYWLNFILLLIAVFLIGYESIDSAIQRGEFPYLVLILISVVLLFLRHKLINLKMEVYGAKISGEAFCQANRAAAKLDDWTVLSNTENFFSAIKNVNWQKDGIKITVILQDEKLYLNSMVAPSMRSNPFSFGWNKKNKLALIRQYQSIMKGEDVGKQVNAEIEKREQAFWDQSEWTFKAIIKRMIGYGLTMLFLVIAFLMFMEGGAKEVIYGITIVLFCAYYIYYDVKVILEKKKKRS